MTDEQQRLIRLTAIMIYATAANHMLDNVFPVPKAVFIFFFFLIFYNRYSHRYVPDHKTHPKMVVVLCHLYKSQIIKTA